VLIAAGRLWWLRIYYLPDGEVHFEIGLSQLSILARLDIRSYVGPQRKKLSSTTKINTKFEMDGSSLLVPRAYV